MAILSSADMFFTAYEPKLKNRFIFYIDGIPAYLVKSADKPKYVAEEVVLDHINVKRKVKGKSDWSNISCTLYDPVTPSGAQAVMEWVRLHHESVTGRDGYSDFYKKDIRFNTLGPVGDVVEEWICKGAYVTNAEFGGGDWTSSDPMEITLTIAMDYAILNY
jgi:hypothetical protein|tara:strand:+ start:1897 stop:2382 length:486 start_codon:yes stop_codon:yes gene_type:complete